MRGYIVVTQEEFKEIYEALHPAARWRYDEHGDGTLMFGDISLTLEAPKEHKWEDLGHFANGNKTYLEKKKEIIEAAQKIRELSGRGAT